MAIIIRIDPPRVEDPVLHHPYKSRFRFLTKQQVERHIGGQKQRGDDETELFLQGDHWQKGRGWIGPPDMESPAYTQSLRKIERQFTFKDVIREILDRVVNGVAKQEAKVSATIRDVPLGINEDELELSDAQIAQIDQYKRMISTWWDHVQFHQKVRQAIRFSRAFGRGYLRVWFPESQLVDPDPASGAPEGSKFVPTGTIEQTLMRMHAEAPHPSSCAILIDEATSHRASAFRFKRDNKDFIELAWVEHDDNGDPIDTIVRVFGEHEAEDYSWNLGGRLPIVEMETSILIDDAIKRQQKRVNFYETSINRTVETASFPERYITNAEPSGILVRRTPGDDPSPYPTRVIAGVTYEIHPVPRVLGAGIVTEVHGIKYKDSDGKENYTTPEVTRFEPVDPEGIIRAIRHSYQTMLEQAKQGHVLIVGDATASGVSRQQAEGDHLTDLAETKSAAEALTRSTLEVTLAKADFFSGQSEGFLREFRVTADLFLTAGTPSPEMLRVNKEIHEAGGVSKEEYLSRIGVEDPSAMIEALEQDDVYITHRHIRRAEAMDKLMMTGWTFEGAAKAVGYTDDEIAEAMSGTPRDDALDVGDDDREDNE